ncbi:MAG: hypothetical protein IPK26_24215 [Planctomycetes bacterium]|nr:hypothetical protein [Planctomycetota bacterium]
MTLRPEVRVFGAHLNPAAVDVVSVLEIGLGLAIFSPRWTRGALLAAAAFLVFMTIMMIAAPRLFAVPCGCLGLQNIRSDIKLFVISLVGAAHLAALVDSRSFPKSVGKERGDHAPASS